ncbi:MAG: hypothetical protein R2860_13815 [Desulfobacterales bacterium]
MGIAFAAALMGIYILMIIQTGSFFMPLLIMMAIPLTLIGILPGFWLLNIVAGNVVGGYDDLIFHCHQHDRHDCLRRHCDP